MSVLTDLRTAGSRTCSFVVCDGLKRPTRGRVQRVAGRDRPVCIINLIRNTSRLGSRRDWDALKWDVKPTYTTVNATAARAALEEAGTWGTRYPAVVRLWDNASEEFLPFLDYDLEIRRVICSTNAIESLNVPLQANDQDPWPLPHRASRPEVSVSGDPLPGPHRDRPGTMDYALEASTERVRRHLQRPILAAETY